MNKVLRQPAWNSPDAGAGAMVNTTRRFTNVPFPTMASASLGWGAGLIIKHDAAASANSGVLMGFGVAGAASSMQLCTFGGTQYGVQARDGAGVNFTAGVVYPVPGYYLLMLVYDRVGTAMKCVLARYGSVVTAFNDTSTVTFADIVPGGTGYIAGDGTGWFGSSVCEAFVYTGYFPSFGEITQLAKGTPANKVFPAANLKTYYPLKRGLLDLRNRAGTLGERLTVSGVGWSWKGRPL